MLALSHSRSLSSQGDGEGPSCCVLRLFLGYLSIFWGSPLTPGVGWGGDGVRLLSLFSFISGMCVFVCVVGDILSLFSLMFHLFVHYLGRNLPLGLLSGSRSLSS